MSEEAEAENEKLLGEKQKQIFLGRVMPVSFEREGEAYKRQELGLLEDKFLIAIVGNRLDIEIDEAFVQVMEKVCQEVSNAAFVIIGIIEEKKDMLAEKFRGHIYFLGYQTKLLNVYGALDLYMNPKREGGGHSALMALTEGVPVLTLPKCDVAQNVGEEFVVETYDEMISEICRYTTDAAYYKKKSEDAKKHISKNTEEKQVKYVEEMLDGIRKTIFF